MSPQDRNLLAHVAEGAQSAERIAADASDRLTGLDPNRRSEDEDIIDALGARAEDLALLLRRESERAVSGIDGGRFRPALMSFAADFFLGALESGRQVGMATDRWGLEWLADSGYRTMADVEQERQAAIAEIGEARATVADLLRQAQAQSELVRREAEEKLAGRRKKRFGLPRR